MHYTCKLYWCAHQPASRVHIIRGDCICENTLARSRQLSSYLKTNSRLIFCPFKHLKRPWAKTKNQRPCFSDFLYIYLRGERDYLWKWPASEGMKGRWKANGKMMAANQIYLIDTSKVAARHIFFELATSQGSFLPTFSAQKIGNFFVQSVIYDHTQKSPLDIRWFICWKAPIHDILDWL